MTFDAIMGFIGGMFAVFLIASAVIFVLNAIASYKIFKKAGESGWKAWIPFLNDYTEYKFAWKKGVFWLTIVLAVAAGIITAATSEDESTVWPVVTSLISLVVAVLNLIKQFKISKVFGHGAGFGLGMIFLPTIFRWILGFGSSQYQGKETKAIGTEQ